MIPVQFINDAASLNTLCETLKNYQDLAIDTEFIREKTYYPNLCLIQIATDDIHACIDPLAIQDLSPLENILQDTAITKIFHSGKQDIEIFYQRFNTIPAPVFDTQIAASLLGQGDQVGYSKLVKQLLGVDLDKSHSYTDWSQRPLTEKQIDYAINDVIYLLKVYYLQKTQLEELNRLDWLDLDQAALLDARQYQPSPESCWKKIKGVRKLKKTKWPTLKQLTAWRERYAMTANRPRRHIIHDDVLLNLARLQPLTLQELEQVRGIQSGLVNKHGQALLECIHTGRQQTLDDTDMVTPRPLNEEQEATADALSAILKQCAIRAKISPQSIATHSDIVQMIQGTANAKLMTGWRYQYAGQHMEKFLSGQALLTLNDQKHLTLIDKNQEAARE